MKTLDTEDLSIRFRAKAIDLKNKSVSITNFYNSEQEKDIKEKPNCDGFGRVRHFKMDRGSDWPPNPLPILPAARALNVNPENELRAQVFQNSVCNWRCWYCFVDFKLLSGNANHSAFKSSTELLDLYLKEPDRPLMIDLTGGQPDLTPEWIPWMMEALMEYGLYEKVYLWSDDNLSNDYFWKCLDSNQIDLVQSYKMYGRVCCFKGIEETSFSLNTLADPSLFEQQFFLVERLMNLDIDLYFYITLTAPKHTNFELAVPRFIDRIQRIHENLPLRIVPLEVFQFSPVTSRISGNESRQTEVDDLISGQYDAMRIWKSELKRRFSPSQLSLPITDVSIRS